MFNSKSFPTNVARMGLLPWMGCDMTMQCRMQAKLFTAVWTRKWIQVCLMLLVNVQWSTCLECFPTYITHKWTLPCMNPSIVISCTLVGKFSSTYVTVFYKIVNFTKMAFQPHHFKELFSTHDKYMAVPLSEFLNVLSSSISIELFFHMFTLIYRSITRIWFQGTIIFSIFGFKFILLSDDVFHIYAINNFHFITTTNFIPFIMLF